MPRQNIFESDRGDGYGMVTENRKGESKTDQHKLDFNAKSEIDCNTAGIVLASENN